MNKISQVWKFMLQPFTQLQLPVNSHVLSADAQDGDICIWVLVNTDPTVEHESRFFEVHGTGHQINEIPELRFIDTVLLNDGHFVFHVFERVSTPACPSCDGWGCENCASFEREFHEKRGGFV